MVRDLEVTICFINVGKNKRLKTYKEEVIEKLEKLAERIVQNNFIISYKSNEIVISQKVRDEVIELSAYQDHIGLSKDLILKELTLLSNYNFNSELNLFLQLEKDAIVDRIVETIWNNLSDD